MHVSLILTVLDEARTLRPLLDSLAGQTRPPNEIVVADGGSTDGTAEILAEYAGRLPLRLVSAPGSNIARGRNTAIRQATGEIVAVTDAGVRADPRWLEELLQPFASGPPSPPLTARQDPGATPPVSDPGPHAVAGFFVPEGDTPFEIAMGATVLPQAEEVNPETYLPSSRSVVFRRAVWQAVGGYPEWLDFCEDVVFDLEVRRRFGPFLFRPQAVVRFRPRSSLRQFVRQYYQYARGDGKAGLFAHIHAVRYLTYLVLAPLIAYAGFLVSPWLWLLYVAGGLAYVSRPYHRLRPRLRTLSAGGRLAAVLYVPVIRLVGDLAKMAGYPAGVAWRIARFR